MPGEAPVQADHRTLPAAALPEIISALSFALDLTEGALPGHALRCTLLGMRLGRALHLPPDQLEALFYALQLKDLGCSSNASRMSEIVGGDDRQVKAVAKLADWTGLRYTDRRTLLRLWSLILPGRHWSRRLTRLLQLSLNQGRNNQEIIRLRCERGAAIVRKLGLGSIAAETVFSLDEHWNGRGYPSQLRGAAIPLLARICSVAQNLDIFASRDGAPAAIRLLRKRSGRWFDPTLVSLAQTLHRSGDLWRCCQPGCSLDLTRQAVLLEGPPNARDLGADRIDSICEAFAGVIDAKSPFTYQHSLRVTRTALEIGRELSLPDDRLLLLRRAALLHDLGKLGVPSTILDKPSSLTPDERAVMATHPLLARNILEHITSFREIARIAGEHHERLDGTGYPLGLSAPQLGLESRILAVADSFVTLAEDRPYRKAMPTSTILSTLRALCPHRLDPVVLAAVERSVAHQAETMQRIFAARFEQQTFDPARRIALPR